MSKAYDLKNHITKDYMVWGMRFTGLKAGELHIEIEGKWMKKRDWILAFALPLLMSLVMSLPNNVIADSDSLTPNVTVGNTVPNIIYSDTALASYDPSEGGSTYVVMTINVTDENGLADLNDSKCECQVDDAGTFVAPVVKYTNSSCTVIGDVGSTRKYACTVKMDFWDSAGTYSTKVFAGDAASTVSNDTAGGAPTYAYTTLVASNVSTTSITWASAVVGVSNQASGINPLVVTNRGNSQLKINITGSDVTNGNIITVGNFSVDLDNNAGNGEQALTISSALINVDSEEATVAQGSDGTPSPVEQIYFWADIPSGTATGSYTGSWTLDEYAG